MTDGPAGAWRSENVDDLKNDGETGWRYPVKNLAYNWNYCEL